MNCINRCCWKSHISTFLNTDKEAWLEHMVSRFKLVHPHPAGPEQIRAWSSCYDILQESFGQLPRSYHHVRVVFEYVLPKHRPGDEDTAPDPGVRPDVLLLTRNCITVLEFKQRRAAIPQFEKQALKYRNRLQNWHVQSKGMSKHTVLVLTEADDLLEKKHHITDCSPDRLAEVLHGFMDDTPTPMCRAQLKRWLNSEHAVREKK